MLIKVLSGDNIRKLWQIRVHNHFSNDHQTVKLDISNTQLPFETDALILYNYKTLDSAIYFPKYDLISYFRGSSFFPHATSEMFIIYR